ncbi:MAG: tRNA (adenosine(37)-N6)-dimethylallyltransferase MiaA [Minisyncoccia bacterium]
MKKSSQKVLVILGPTATGKSDLAVKLAKKFNGEVISADSRQVYKGLDIGTGKITKKEMCGIPHHLLDIASPKTNFNIAKWQKLANKKILEIFSRNKLPIICGGTGFYIDAVTKGIILPEVLPNKKLREKLENKTASELCNILKKLDPNILKSIDVNNPVRLIRAIEIAKKLGRVPSIKIQKPKFEILNIGLKLDDKILRENINKRLKKRISGGMIQEAVNLHKKGLSYKRMNELGLEYRYLAMYLQNKQPLKASSGSITISKDEMIEKLQFEIWHYAKRQMTWFKRDKSINWFNPNDKATETLVSKFLTRKPEK